MQRVSRSEVTMQDVVAVPVPIAWFRRVLDENTAFRHQSTGQAENSAPG